VTFREVRSPVDLLRSSGGIFVIESGEGGFDRITSVNGLRPGTMATLKDGMVLNDPSSGLFAAGIYPVGFAERVEIVSPSAGPFYALNGVGGAVNYVSRNIRAVRPVSQIRYTQSAYGYSILDGSLTQDVARGLNVGVGLRRPSYDGRYLNSGVDAWEGRAAVRIDLGGAAVHVSDLFTRWERGLNGGVSPATPDSLLYDRIRADVVNESAREMLVRHDFAAGISFGDPADPGLRTSLDLQFGSRTRRYIDEAGGTGSTGTPFRETRREQSAGFRLEHSRRIAGMGITPGVEFRDGRLLEDPNVGAHKNSQAAAFVRITADLPHSLLLSPWARLDRALGLTRFSAGVEGTLGLTDRLLLHGSVSRSHRFPTLIEAFGVSAVALPLAAVEAERHDLLSGGFTAGDSSGTFISGDLFHRRVSDALALDSAAGGPAGLLAFHTIPAETRTGASVALRVVAWSIVAEVNADYLSYGGDVTRRYAPAWSIAGGLFFRGRSVGGHLDLKAGFRGRYFTAYDGGQLSRRYEIYLPSSTAVAPAATLDFMLVAGLGDADIHFIWENLLDRHYYMEVLYPADDRSIRIGVTWSFLD